MALVEVEINAPQFSRMVDLILTTTPVPVPTLAVLGPDRLIDSMKWEAVTLGLGPPNYTPPTGALVARATVKVAHVSIAELDADPLALPTETTLIAFLLLTASPDEVIVSAIQFNVGTVSPFVFGLPLRIGGQAIPLQGDVTPVAAYLLQRDNVVTLRLCTSAADEMSTPPANRIEDTGSAWLVRVSGELFKEKVLQPLIDAVTPPPAGTTVEDPPTASWESRSDGPWQVFGSVGVLKRNACPTLFGKVSLSIRVDANLTLTPNVNNNSVELRLVISSDVSDWDVLRCWAGTGGIVALTALVNPIVGGAGAIASLVAIGEAVRLLAGKEATSPGVSGFREVARTDTSVTFEGTTPLPALDNPSVPPVVGPDGLIVQGNFSTLLLTAEHDRRFSPSDGMLRGEWASGYSCSRGGWDDAYVVESVVVRDKALILKKLFRNVLVTVFPTTRVVPSAQWQVTLPRPAIDPHITIDALFDPPPGQTGRIFLHTSAGVRRYDLAPVSIPKVPTARQIAEGRLNCLMPFLPPLIELRWLPDPPPFDLGMPAVRHWLVVINKVHKAAVLNFHTVRDGRDVADPISVVAPRSGPVTFEFVTDATTTLKVHHNSEVASASCRVMQRWLMPLRTIDLPGPATALFRRGETLTVHAGGEIIEFNTCSGEVERSSGASRAREVRSPASLFSVRLNHATLAVAFGSKLMLARRWEGSAQRSASMSTPTGEADYQPTATEHRSVKESEP